MSCSTSKAKYATNSTPEEFWNEWKEQKIEQHEIERIKHRVVADEIRREIIERRAAPSISIRRKRRN